MVPFANMRLSFIPLISSPRGLLRFVSTYFNTVDFFHFVLHFPPNFDHSHLKKLFVPLILYELLLMIIMFLLQQLWVGIMLTTQPFFIAGIEDVEVATRSAFGAFFTFMFVFVLSAVGMWYDSTFGKKSAAEEGDGETDYQLAGGQEFPNYGTSS